MQNKYKLLFYLEPWLEISYKEDQYRSAYFTNFIQNIISHLQDFEISLLISDVHYEDLSNEVKTKYNFYIIKQKFLIEAFKSYRDYSLYEKIGEKIYLEYLRSLGLPKEINIIYSISSDLHYLNLIYNQVPKLFLESGIINGYDKICPRMYLDPYVYNKGSNFLSENYDKIVSYVETEDDVKNIKNIQQEIKQQTNSHLIDILRKKYKNIYLLALENFDSYFSRVYHKETYAFSYVLNIVSKIPKNSVVIITEHKRYPFITANIIKYLNSLDINIIFEKNIKSNVILPYIDGLIACFSTLLLNAIILEKPIFVASEKSYLYKYSDAKNIEDFIEFIESNKKPNKAKISAICFLINKYYLNTFQLLNCSDYLKKVIEYYNKNGIIDFSFYQHLKLHPHNIMHIDHNRILNTIGLLKKSVKDFLSKKVTFLLRK